MAGIIRAMRATEAIRSRRVLRGLAVLSVMVMAFCAGMLVERLRFDAKREDMLRRYNQVLQQYHDEQMHSEKSSRR
jgi:Na+/H+ antiporter NhaB